LGLARLTKVTVISPRSEYEEVAKALAQFESFHPISSGPQNFDPRVQELAVKAVRLFAQADQAVKDLGLQVAPGWMDMVFGGVKIEKSNYEAVEWNDLLEKAEGKLDPIVQEVRTQKAALQKVVKEESDARTTMDALETVSSLSADLTGLTSLKWLRAAVCIVRNSAVSEFRSSLPSPIFQVQQLNQAESLVLVAVKASDGLLLDRAIKALEIRTLLIPPGLPQNPTEAYRKLERDAEAARSGRIEIEARLSQIREKSGSTLLAVRELTDVARSMLDDARASGEMKRLAMISGYIPAKEEGRFRDLFGRWMIFAEPAGAAEDHKRLPVLFENRQGIRTWQLITAEQGVPGNHEVDPTPLVAFVFPIFFGLMFGDFGHGLLLTLFVLFVRQRTAGTKRQWANIFLVTGISSMFFGAVFGEFFGLSLYKFLPIPSVIEIIQRPLSGNPTPNIGNIEIVMVASILIGIAHLTTGLALNIYEGWRAGETLELLTEKLPALSMYIGGVGYGLAFIGAGFNFNVLAIPTGGSNSAPLLGVPNNELGAVSLAILVPSMLILLGGKAVAVKLGKVRDLSIGGALSNGGLEVFEKILQFLSNTISYVRLAVMLLVHAVLLMIVNMMFPLTNPALIPAWIIFNLLVLALEGLIVYVQDLRLHVYEFFTKFYTGTGTPFRRILPPRARVSIKWL
jgi:V/A-type H+-transporting ATPase subunit I